MRLVRESLVSVRAYKMDAFFKKLESSFGLTFSSQKGKIHSVTVPGTKSVNLSFI